MTSVTFAHLTLPCNLPLMSHESGKSSGAAKAVRSRYSEVQSAPRFPVKLPMHIKSQAGESDTESDNISANGVLLHHQVDMPLVSTIEFTTSLSASVLGS